MSVTKENVFVIVLFTLCLTGCIKDAASLECYSCPSKGTANGCQATSSCGQDQVCMLRRTVNNITQEIHYESKCEDKTVCDLELDRYRAILSALVSSKRAIMKQILAGDVCLIQCCDQDLCNNGCVKPSQQSFLTKTMTSLPSSATNISPAFFPPTKSLISMTSQKDRSSSALSSLKIIVPTKPVKTTKALIAPTSQMTSTKDIPKPLKTTTENSTPIASSKAPITAISQITSTKPVESTTESQTSVASTKAPIAATNQMTSTTPVKTTTESPTSIASTKAPITATHQMTSTKDISSISGSTTSRHYTSKADHSDIPTTSNFKQDCPYGFVRFNTSCYMFGKHEMSFHDAKSFCANHNSHLVHVDSAGENEFLKNHFKMMHRGPIQYWIGITDEIKESVWQFYDSGKVPSFYNWSPGEPDGTQSFDGNANADCAVFDPYLDFQWRDEDCSPYQYSEPVCEISQ